MTDSEQEIFKYERYGSISEIRDKIRMCEGNHVQQVVYSTFMDTLTQICFTEQVIRGTIYWQGNRSWSPEGDDNPNPKRGQD